jgi:hypothetical protein
LRGGRDEPLGIEIVVQANHERAKPADRGDIGRLGGANGRIQRVVRNGRRGYAFKGNCFTIQLTARVVVVATIWLHPVADVILVGSPAWAIVSYWMIAAGIVDGVCATRLRPSR